MKIRTTLHPYQTNKEFVEAAQIAKQDAFIAVAIRRIVGNMLEIPVRELVADLTFETVMQRAGYYTDWDQGVFEMEFEEYFNITIIDCEKCYEAAKNAGYPNWFYNPDNYDDFSFLWKPFIFRPPPKKITFGEWVKIVIEKIFAPFRNEIIPLADWSGIETSDLESDTVIHVDNFRFFLYWGCLIVTIIILLLFYNL
ncbi:MAG: hypothetical protein LBF88_03840 [Planctomycetaceae bacterium]|jgi:hypothetical protein|nr:hypothetical protein [Planctomycetaceae bacterium]